MQNKKRPKGMPRWKWNQERPKEKQEEVSSGGSEELMRKIHTEFWVKVSLGIILFGAYLAFIYWRAESTYDPNAPVNYQQEENNALQDAQDNSYRGF